MTAAEKLELTRSRNRMHAKTTRERKKVRLAILEGVEEAHDLSAAAKDLSERRALAAVSIISRRGGGPLDLSLVLSPAFVFYRSATPHVIGATAYERDCAALTKTARARLPKTATGLPAELTYEVVNGLSGVATVSAREHGKQVFIVR